MHKVFTLISSQHGKKSELKEKQYFKRNFDAFFALVKKLIAKWLLNIFKGRYF